MENEVIEVMPKYKPLSTDQKLRVRESQFQLINLREQSQAQLNELKTRLEQALKTVSDNLSKTISDIGLENGILPDAKVEFKLDTLEFADRK
jgi:hypothetical protein